MIGYFRVENKNWPEKDKKTEIHFEENFLVSDKAKPYAYLPAKNDWVFFQTEHNIHKRKDNKKDTVQIQLSNNEFLPLKTKNNFRNYIFD